MGKRLKFKKSDILKEDITGEFKLAAATSGVDALKNIKFEQEEIEGGLADDKSVKDIAKKHNVNIKDIVAQIKKGKEVEMEHTDDPNVAIEIAKDHEMEHPFYYDALEDMEKELEEGAKLMESFFKNKAEDRLKMVHDLQKVIDTIKSIDNLEQKEVAQNILNQFEKNYSKLKQIDTLVDSLQSQLDGVLSEEELDEATTGASSGAFVGPMSGKPIKRTIYKTDVPVAGAGGMTKPIGKIMSFKKKQLKESNVTTKQEIIDEALGMEAIPTYDTPGWGNSEFMLTKPKKGKKGKVRVRKGKDYKNTYKFGNNEGSTFVKVKDKCKKFPYCSQGPDAIELSKTIPEGENKMKSFIKKLLNESIKETKSFKLLTERENRVKANRLLLILEKEIKVGDNLTKKLNNINTPLAKKLLAFFNSDKIKNDANVDYVDYDKKNEKLITLGYRDMNGKVKERLFKINKLIKYLGSDINDIKDYEIEDLIGHLKQADTSQLKMVEGDDILKAYHCENYEDGETMGSCMRFDYAQEYLKIYTDNPNEVKCLVLLNPETNKVRGRALIWHMDNDKYFMDRVYTTNKEYNTYFNNYAEENGISKSANSTVTLENGGEYDTYPYMDTFQYYHPESGSLAADGSEVEGSIRLQDTSGGHSEAGVYIEYGDHEGETVDEDEAYYISYRTPDGYREGYAHQDDITIIDSEVYLMDDCIKTYDDEWVYKYDDHSFPIELSKTIPEGENKMKLPSRNDIKEGWKKFVEAAKREGKETTMAAKIIKKVLVNEDVTEKELKFVKEQSGDILKIFGVVTMGAISTALPILVEKMLNKKGLSILPKERSSMLDDKEELIETISEKTGKSKKYVDSLIKRYL